MPQLNIAFYCFAPLTDLPALKSRWLPALRELGVKGTLLLAPEGINGFLAGEGKSVESALELLRSHPPLAELRAKESRSSSVPFRKLCIKIKKEIVTFRVPGLSVETAKTKRLPPQELARWYSQGRDFIALDTRNDYEANLGTFENATVLPIQHFVDLAKAARGLPEDWKTKPIVTFCTGGIRCEKAAPFLETLGFEEVYQLEDGILGYFEAVGGAHWKGECFVFDQRIGLAPDLSPTSAWLCGSCQWPMPKGLSRCSHCGAAAQEP